MPSLRLIGAVTVLGAATLYQQIFHNLIFNIYGVGRSMQPLSDFPYTCKRIYHEKLESCEDLWLDNENRQLYLACAGLKTRAAYDFEADTINASGIVPGAGWITVLDIDTPGADGLYGLRALSKPGFKGYQGDGTVVPGGFAVEKVDRDMLRFYVTDFEPKLDPATGKPVEEVSTLKRSAIHVFEHRRGSGSMQFKYELSGEVVDSPNRVTVLKDGNILFTNDHSHGAGLRRELEPITGGGNLAHCDTTTRACHVAVTRGLAFPNGLQRGPDDLVYVPNCFSGQLQAYSVQANGSTTLVNAWHHPMLIDNLAFDAAGDLWGPGIPKVASIAEAKFDPYNKSWFSTIWRWRREENSEQGGKVRWTAKKMLEDKEREVVAGITTVEHDVKTGRLFLTGVYTPYIVVCDPK